MFTESSTQLGASFELRICGDKRPSAQYSDTVLSDYPTVYWSALKSGAQGVEGICLPEDLPEGDVLNESGQWCERRFDIVPLYCYLVYSSSDLQQLSRTCSTMHSAQQTTGI